MQEDGTTIRAIPTEEYFARVRRQLSEEGYAYVRVTGVSMQPLLRHLRDGVVLIPPELIKRGDIVLFDRKNGRYALHRVIRKGKNGFMMAGDNQWHYETNLSYDQIVGVASEIVRGEKRIPCSNFFLKCWTFLVTQLTLPRIYIWKAFVRVGKLVRHSENSGRKGAEE